MTDGLAPLEAAFAGPLSGFRGGLCLPTDAHAARAADTETWSFAADELFEDATLDAVLARYLGGPPPWNRAGVSLWSHLYACTVVLPVVAALHNLGRCYPTHPAALTLHLDARGVPARVMPCQAETVDAERALQDLLGDHLAPLCRALRRRGGLSEKIAWGNLGNLFEWAQGELYRQELAVPDRALEVQARPLTRTITYAGAWSGGAQRWRTTCCLRDQLEGGSRCATCPLRRKHLRRSNY